jgi:hypothetical protein
MGTHQGLTDRADSSTPGRQKRKNKDHPPIHPLSRMSKVIAAESSITASHTCDRRRGRKGLQDLGVG